jgi:trehalose-6-phosphate synthase
MRGFLIAGRARARACAEIHHAAVRNGQKLHRPPANPAKPLRAACGPRFVELRGTMPKVILVTSREPYVLKRAGAEISAQRVRAGLLGALEPLLSSSPGHFITWSGLEREGVETLPERVELSIDGAPWTLRRVPVSEREASLFYYGFACRTIWPLMHLMLGRVSFDAEAWRAFRRVNQRFADAVLEIWQPGDRIWVLDHALALVPGMLREAQPEARIAMTWGIPWAPVEVVRALPWAGELVRGILGADQVGLSLSDDVDRFLGAVSLAGGETLAADRVAMGGRTPRVGAFPFGCDAQAWSARAQAARGGRVVRLKRSLGAEKLALAVDRVERTRGIAERVRAFERFFDRYPSWRGRLVLAQIAVPSRTRAEDYRELKREIDEAVARVNARFGVKEGSGGPGTGKDGWQPVRYLYRPFEPEELAVYYAAADVLVATPLADGLSFVPLEYAASRTRDDGGLIVSSLAGAASYLPEAHAVNPYDEEATAQALRSVLEGEGDGRMRALRERARRNDARGWLDRFHRAAFGEELPLAAGLEPTLDLAVPAGAEIH